jgi:spermidine synthase
MIPTLNLYFVLFLSAGLALCSLLYEFILAQIMSVTVGGTKNQYMLIISIFTFSLGAGSLVFGKIKHRWSTRRIFIVSQLFLAVMGGVAPFLIVKIFPPNMTGMLINSLRICFAYGLVSLIGILSGFELPLLFSLIPEKEGVILGFDYFGMLVATISFPFFLLPFFGIAGSAILIAVTNIFFVAALLIVESKKRGLIFTLIGFYAVSLYAIYYSRELLNNILTLLYLG